MIKLSRLLILFDMNYIASDVIYWEEKNMRRTFPNRAIFIFLIFRKMFSFYNYILCKLVLENKIECILQYLFQNPAI